MAGNLETLRDKPRELGIDVRQQLLEFHQRFYSANVMRLVVLGAEPLDQLEAWAREKFSAVSAPHAGHGGNIP